MASICYSDLAVCHSDLPVVLAMHGKNVEPCEAFLESK
jgi:hypothetical protein